MSDEIAAPRLLMPPPFRAYRAAAGDILDAAIARVEEGAGTFVWRESQGVLAFALVLEPAPPLVTCAQEAELGFVAGLAALCDMLAHHGLPERQVQIDWPARVLYDNAIIAGARWRMGPLGDDGLPLWAIFGAEILVTRHGMAEAGEFPNSTSLSEEEFPPAPELMESFAAFLKLIVDRWSQEGREAVLRRVLDRVPGHDALKGAKIVDGRLQLPPLSADLQADLWRDPVRGGPRW